MVYINGKSGWKWGVQEAPGEDGMWHIRWQRPKYKTWHDMKESFSTNGDACLALYKLAQKKSLDVFIPIVRVA